MTPQALFGLTYLPSGLAVVVAMLGDMFVTKRSARVGSAALLMASGVTALVAGWSMAPTGVASSFLVGGYASTIAGVVLLMTALAVLGAPPEAPGSAFVLAPLAAITASLAAGSVDLLATVICLESAALCSYALVSVGGTPTAQEAGMKYFVQGAVATGLLVLGIASLLPSTATLSFSGIAAGAVISAQSAALAFGVMAVVAGLAFKIGAAPFHSWAPDAYEQAHPFSAAVLSGPVKLSMIVALSAFTTSLRSLGASAEKPLGTIGLAMVGVLGIGAILSVVLGSTVALGTRSYTRMLGYAGVAQVGYALIALAALGPAAAIAFGVTYALASVGAFVAAESFRRLRPGWDGSISGLGGMAAEAPVLSAALTVVLMSLAGIPPLFGFWGKFQAFGSAVGAAAGLADAGMHAPAVWMGILAAVGIVGSIVSLGYYGSVVRAMYFGDAQEERTDSEKGQGRAEASTAVVAFSAVVLLAAGAAPLFWGITSTISGFLLS